MTVKVASKYEGLKFVFLMLFLWLLGCKDPASKNKLAQIDQLFASSETKLLDTFYMNRLDSTRNFIEHTDLFRKIQFYKIKQLHYQALQKYHQANIYADSALSLFENDDIISAHKDLYFNALLDKGDAVYLSKKFSQAVLYYLEAKSFRERNLDACYDKELAVCIGNVYYVQSKFVLAAGHYKESYKLELECPIATDAVKHFNNIQAILNNTGYCYEKANMVDSAQHFYQKDLDFINLSAKNIKIPKYAIADASAVALDNLGGAYLQKGDLINAEKLLLNSISIKYSGGESFKIPPLIKLANLYIEKKDFKRAEQSFSTADSLLKLTVNDDLQSRWHKARSTYYSKKGDFKSAYQQMEIYLKLRTVVNKEQANLSSINVEKDFASLEQKYHLQDLEKKNALQNAYLLFAAFLLLLFFIIAFLLFRNSKQSKRNHNITKLHNQELQETLKKLEEANQNYARVMKIMAHDLRNPLSGISGLSSLLLAQDQLSADSNDSLHLIKTSADNANSMINEILNAVLSTNEYQTIEKETFDLHLVIEQCVALLNFKAAEKKQKLVINFENNTALPIYANKEKLWRVFSNIIVNAIKFSHEAAIIQLNIDKSEKNILISIIDNGIGIPKEFNSKIFDMFTETKRLGTSGEKPYGLGLSISKQIVEAHHGKLWFESNPKGGTIFYIELPILDQI